MRKNETEEIRSAFSRRKLKLVCIDAHERFLRRIAGVTDPERKRKLIGEEFVRTFEDAARECGSPEFLAQGTIYPDIVESGANSAVIKSHHNVGGLPEDMGFKGVIEPLSGLFKDEVRQLGAAAGPAAAARVPPALPRPRAGHTHHRRGDGEQAGHTAGGGRHRARGDRRVPRAGRPVLRRAHQHAQRGRDGRRAHV